MSTKTKVRGFAKDSYASDVYSLYESGRSLSPIGEFISANVVIKLLAYMDACGALRSVLYSALAEFYKRPTTQDYH
ncbi:hypothetical protein BSFA1_75660 (plasmid) [Burkholderia sp. SFA1]|nr:hypothetical protein BSFA1_75660 [Burkholderia sp. SFA1]